MILALYILLAIVLVGAVLKLLDLRHTKSPDSPLSSQLSALDSTLSSQLSPLSSKPEGCCGQHEVCEKVALADSPVYFDDEELDQYAGRAADAYSDDEVEQFRDVLLTLIPSDLAPWNTSIEKRGITLPAPIRDELIMLMSEARYLTNQQ